MGREFEDGGGGVGDAPAGAAAASAPPRRAAASSRLVAWLVLSVAIVACASGGIWFAALSSTPPATRAAWRLGATAALQAPFFAAQWRRAAPALRARVLGEGRSLALAGAALALHFVSWSVSVARTSLANSLLFVSTTPLLLVAVALARAGAAAAWRRWRGAPPPGLQPPPPPPATPTFLEITGTVAGVACAALLDLALLQAALGASGGGGGGGGGASAGVAPSLDGDAWALLGAACMVVYLSAGARLRSWMPLFLYAFPVTATAYIFAAAAALLWDGAAADPLGAAGIAGCVGSWPRFGLTLGAGVVSGMLGHTGANYALGEISALVVSVLLLLDPVIGSFIGWLAGFQAPPDGWTVVWGLALVACAAVVVLGDASYDYSARAWAAVTCGAAAAAPPATDAAHVAACPAAEADGTAPLARAGGGGDAVQDGALDAGGGDVLVKMQQMPPPPPPPPANTAAIPRS
jgi:drug/metabolite transporter (DMT)-like permease